MYLNRMSHTIHALGKCQTGALLIANLLETQELLVGLPPAAGIQFLFQEISLRNTHHWRVRLLGITRPFKIM
jgi:hypothetical protein